ncbi:MAG: hypothetical protein FWG44_00160 [Oscillospiraceae bacterium]|nr:hypothetical protein [Oscillospiraceae bacterium]
MNGLQNFFGSDKCPSADKFPHAVCFIGDDVSRLAELAEETAKAILCGKNPACLTCINCKKVQNKMHPDIFRVRELSPDNKYKVDFVRKVAADSVFRPNDGDLKVYIFNEADEMSPVCQNALLKFTEEPPEYVRIIFTVKTKENLLDTIKSRLVFINAQNTGNGVPGFPELQETAELFISALVKGNEYLAAAALTKIKTREETAAAFKLISEAIRKLTVENRTANIKILIEVQKFTLDCIDDLQFNPNIALACTNLTSGIFSRLK